MDWTSLRDIILCVGLLAGGIGYVLSSSKKSHNEKRIDELEIAMKENEILRDRYERLDTEFKEFKETSTRERLTLLAEVKALRDTLLMVDRVSEPYQQFGEALTQRVLSRIADLESTLTSQLEALKA